jgi:hypothetical protein
MNTNLDFSLKGCVVINDTTAAPAAEYYACQVVADSVIASMTFSPTYDNTGDWSDLTSIPAGTLLFGRFTTLTLTSGEVILHKI